MSSKPAILAVEDSPASQALLRAQLQHGGYAVTIVGTAKAALQQLHQRTHGLALIDLELPDLHGLALAQQHRQWETANGCPRLPLLAVTGHNTPDYVAQAVAAGFDGLLAKPYRLAQLLERVAQLLTFHNVN
jgi:two-component system sensor histidine kinase EvgS